MTRRFIVQLEIWSDYACPYCYIGKRFLDQALAEFEHAKDVQITFKAFELDPTASPVVVNTTQQRIEYKYRKSPEGARDMIQQIMMLGKRVGLDMRYDTVRYTNTFDAHRLAKFAESKGLADTMSERLFLAYFVENRELANHAVLAEIAVELGLDYDETKAMLQSDVFAEQSRADEAQAHGMGIHGVPFFVFDEGLGLSGAQPKASLLQALKTTWSKAHSAEKDRAPVCGEEGCSVPLAG
ncbi:MULTISPECIES: DsbA family oxidoreductase [Rhizobium/Agrobacterium group]|uniref:DsbA family oxidoreductase n=1 Tax=Rhizobium/Agrobacterium group TaxID=227290 RepID=UPI0012E79503|nr:MULTISPECIES: DsbA family oxidoreductase [Rhizobium/Agrobacterium group]